MSFVISYHWFRNKTMKLQMKSRNHEFVISILQQYKYNKCDYGLAASNDFVTEEIYFNEYVSTGYG